MNSIRLAASLLLLSVSIPLLASEDLQYFELRTYFANEGRLDELHARFRDHTVALFEKHGMTNLAYWTPRDNEENALVYLLGYPDKAAREKSWTAFREDPEWKSVYAESTKDGKLIAKVESLFLVPTDYSPDFPTESAEEPRLFEMRRYITNPGKLDALDARFRDHTVELFEKHGLSNVAYFHLEDGQDGSETVLLYFLVHDDEEKRDTGFAAFRDDPEWQSAREASEKDGKILIRNGVESTFLIPTDYSPFQ